MLHDFLASNREVIVARVRARILAREVSKPSETELTEGIPVFLDQLGDALRLAESSDAIDHENLIESAAQHGHDLLRMGLTIGQLVHDYGDVCQTITELAIAQEKAISADDFKTLNLCLDDAIAGAVTAYAQRHNREVAAETTEHLGSLSHELRNLLNTATLAFESIKSGRVPVNGSTGQVLERSLAGLRVLIERSLVDARINAGIGNLERIAVADLLAEIETGTRLQAQVRGTQFTVTPVDPTLAIEGDRQMLVATVVNLLQNAFKFSPKNARVSLTTRVSGDHVLFEVEDECGGLPPGRAENLFLPFNQQSKDRSGLGLGLAICRKAAKAHGGQLSVRDLPGKGCVFTLDLPMQPPSSSADHGGG